jgi:phosphate transport system permease protein
MDTKTGPPSVRRKHSTRWTVRFADRLSRVVITVAGIGTIVAVSGVFLYLIWVVIPLFASGTVESQKNVSVPGGIATKDQSLIAAAVDEYQLLAWSLSSSGQLTVFRVNNGEVLERRNLFDGSPPLTTYSKPSIRSFDDGSGNKVTQVVVAFGFEDGSVRIGKFYIKGSYPAKKALPREVHTLRIGESARVGSGIVLFTRKEQFFLQAVEVDMPPAAKAPARSPVRLIDQTISSHGPVVCTLSENGKLRLNQIKETIPLDPDLPVVRRLVATELPIDEKDNHPRPDTMLLSEAGDQLFLIWNGGRFIRYDLRKAATAKVVEQDRFFHNQEDVHVTAIRQLIGRGTILVGDSTGTVSAWFLTRPDQVGTQDDAVLSRAHQLRGPAGASVTTLDISSRGRQVAVGYSNGDVRLFNVTSEKLVVDVSTGSNQPVEAVLLAPKVDGLLAFGGEKGWHWEIKPGHPEITLGSVFGKVWYESSDRPVHKWESSSGNDSYEPKYGMVPLIFGTIKASVYSLLFGVPLALLAAVYTSEFMRPRTRAIVKPVIEMMASLPSVVLGFLAGLVFAQFVEDKVPTILCAFLFVPLMFVLVAHLAQLLPEKTFMSVTRMRFLAFIFCMPLGLSAAWLVGPIVEKYLFAGDLRAWVVNRKASSVGGWMLLCLPVSVLTTVFVMGNTVTPWLRRVSARWTRFPSAFLDLGRFAGVCAASLLMAFSLSYMLAGVGLDARPVFFDTYSQRNALVAGFAMGFAIIPIIYTIAEDALSAVPEHLRSGSLATGATTWQTAIRIVIPTAMSGLFSAVMIGFGRAVGETMIVVMASGNTPVMEWNAFNGFRTLSANIAVEIPEAERHGTLFATLFLAALVLFCITFVLNTLAEIVRLRFRKKAYQL